MVSSKDVAKYAGVSQTTVSRVLNTPELVKENTYKKVMTAIEELNYIPDGNARSLVQQRTNTIALISGPLHNPFFSDTTTSIVNYANEHGFKVNVHFVNNNNMEETYSSVFENKVDGIILSSILLEDPFFNKLIKMDVPFITFNRKHKSGQYFVEMDNEVSGDLATTHMIESGHEDICWIGGPLTISTFRGRYEGFIQAMKKKSLPINPKGVYNTDASREEVYEAFLELEKLPNKPTAICAATDAIAITLMDFYTSAGYRIPEDISIIGIDNVKLSSHASINLTTVGISSSPDLGHLAIEKLIEMINEKNKPCIQITKSVRLFTRKTTMKKSDVKR